MRKMYKFSFNLDLPVFTFNIPQKKHISIKKTERFHKQKKKIPKAIVEKMDRHEIIYGARALNKRFPSFLDTPTQDYDIYTPYPKHDARELERTLDKKFGGDLKFKSYKEVERTFVDKKLHPLDLKKAVAEELIKILMPIRKTFSR